MNDDKSRTRDFRSDYTALDLHEHADWKSVRTNYRRLVHLWHPDRYTQMPDKRAEAQQRFISLTKSYTHLRTFQRKHGHLPFEHAGHRQTDETMALSNTYNPKQAQLSHTNSGSTNFDANGIDEDIASGVLGRKDTARKPPTSSRTKTRIIWALASCAILFGTLSIFLMLDQKTTQAVFERGREAIREAPASNFMPSAAEIRRSEAKGAFVHLPK